MSKTVTITYRRGTRPCRWELPLRDDDRVQKAWRVPFAWHGETVAWVVRWLEETGATDVTVTTEE